MIGSSDSPDSPLDAPSLALMGPPTFLVGPISIVGYRLNDGTPVLPAREVLAVLEAMSRADQLRSVNLLELQRLDDWVQGALAEVAAETKQQSHEPGADFNGKTNR